MQRIVNAVLLFLDFDLSGTANLDHGHTACQLGQSFLQLLPIVVGGGVIDLDLELSHTSLDGILVTSTVDDGGVVLVDLDALGTAQLSDGGLLQLEAQVFADHCTTRESGNVIQHGLAAITKARSFHSSNLDDAPQLVHNQSGQCFALDVLCDDQQRLASLYHRFQHRKYGL